MIVRNASAADSRVSFFRCGSSQSKPVSFFRLPVPLVLNNANITPQDNPLNLLLSGITLAWIGFEVDSA
jgi:hypothetical protein